MMIQIVTDMYQSTQVHVGHSETIMFGPLSNLRHNDSDVSGRCRVYFQTLWGLVADFSGFVQI